MNVLKNVSIYADGSCLGNPGPGGWAVILKYNGSELVLSGGEPKTTNNRMELRAVIEGLKRLKERCRVTIFTDSQYVAKSVNNGWVYGWMKNGWLKADKKPVSNPELWRELMEGLSKHQAEIIWIKGHAGHPENERCDSLAVSEAVKFKE